MTIKETTCCLGTQSHTLRIPGGGGGGTTSVWRVASWRGVKPKALSSLNHQELPIQLHAFLKGCVVKIDDCIL